MKAISLFGGLVETYTPLSAVRWSAQAQTSANVGNGERVVCYIGRASGGAPKTPYFFNGGTVPDAGKILVGGELLDAVNRALTQNPIPRGVIAVNIQGGTPATYNILDGSAGVVATLTTKTFREPANQAYISLTGAASTGYRIEMVDPQGGGRFVNTRVGLGLYIQYTGNGSAAGLEVLDISGVRTLRVTVTGNASHNLLIPLAGHTVSTLAAKISQSGPYNVFLARDGRLDATTLDIVGSTGSKINILGYNTITSTTADAAVNATTLAVSATSRAIVAGETLRTQIGGATVLVSVTANAASGAVSLTVAALTTAIPSGTVVSESVANTPVALTATKGDLALFFTTKASGLVDYASGASVLAPAAQSGFFTGGSTTADIASDWLDGLHAALDEQVFSTISVLTDDYGIQAGIAAVLGEYSSPSKSRPVQNYRGVSELSLPVTESDVAIASYQNDVSSQVASINDRSTVFVGQSLKVIGSNGLLDTLKPYEVAALVAALRAGTGAGESLTYKNLNGVTPFPNLNRHVDDFTRIGMLVLDTPRRNANARIVRGRTAYVGQDNTVYESEKQVAIMNAITRDIQAIQETMVPGAATRKQLGEYSTALDNYFEFRKENNWLQDGVDEQGNSLPAYEFEVSRTSQYGQLVSTKSFVNPTGEFIAAEHDIIARAVEIEVSQ